MPQMRGERYKKKWKKQNYECKSCGRQFIAPQELSYRGCQKGITERVKHMLVSRVGIRDIFELEGIINFEKQNIYI